MNGDDLRAARVKLRMTQPDLVASLNASMGRSYDKSRFSRWENGREVIPRDVAEAVSALTANRIRDARVIAFANQKGGVGKTTSAMNVAAALGGIGASVLLVDLDPQATASDWLLGRESSRFHKEGASIYHAILKRKSLSECIVSGDFVTGSGTRPFDMVPSHIDLSEADGRREPGFEHALTELLEEIRQSYDFIVIDAPPNLGLMTYMALVAADSVIVPVQTEPPDTMGVALLLDTVQKIQRRLNPNLRVAGILPTRYNARQVVDKEVLQALIQYTADRAIVLEPVPDSAVFGNAAISAAIAVDMSPRAKAVGPYLRLAAALHEGKTPQLALLNISTETAGE